MLVSKCEKNASTQQEEIADSDGVAVLSGAECTRSLRVSDLRLEILASSLNENLL